MRSLSDLRRQQHKGPMRRGCRVHDYPENLYRLSNAVLNVTISGCAVLEHGDHVGPMLCDELECSEEWERLRYGAEGELERL